MKERLDQYTMAQFIDIACGDYSHIGADTETAQKIAEDLIGKYNEIADSLTARTRLVKAENESKNAAKIKLYSILLNLINAHEAYGDVREILCVAKLTNVSAIAEDERLKAKIEQLLRTEKSQRERMLKERQKESVQDVPEDEIRASFDRQTARLMTHFKFAISHESISASAYAFLVEAACRQQRTQAANDRQMAGK